MDKESTDNTKELERAVAKIGPLEEQVKDLREALVAAKNEVSAWKERAVRDATKLAAIEILVKG